LAYRSSSSAVDNPWTLHIVYSFGLR